MYLDIFLPAVWKHVRPFPKHSCVISPLHIRHIYLCPLTVVGSVPSLATSHHLQLLPVSTILKIECEALSIKNRFLRTLLKISKLNFERGMRTSKSYWVQIGVDWSYYGLLEGEFEPKFFNITPQFSCMKHEIYYLSERTFSITNKMKRGRSNCLWVNNTRRDV